VVRGDLVGGVRRVDDQGAIEAERLGAIGSGVGVVEIGPVLLGRELIAVNS